MAASALIAYFRRFLAGDEAAITVIYHQAKEAFMRDLQEVVVTSSNFGDANSAGEYRGDPAVIMEVCETMLQEIAPSGAKTGPERAHHFNFSRRRIET